MNCCPILANRIRRGDPVPLPLALVLSALTPFARIGMNLRLRRPVTTVDVQVVSFGNLTTGGTGKTPAVIERACEETRNGKKVGVLTRGYGTASGSEITIWAQQPSQDDRHLLGDEPSLILTKVPGVTIFQGRDRVRSAQIAVEKHSCDVLILDDGFQYTMLARNENILLIDASNPFGNGHLLPRGILREPLTAISRATEIVLTRCDQADNIGGLLATINRLVPDTPVRKTVHRAVGLRRLSDASTVSIEELQGMELAAACAVGNPDAFFATLEGLGAVISQRHTFRDHAEIPPETFLGTLPVIVTEKDAMRIAAPGENVFALEVELRNLKA